VCYQTLKEDLVSSEIGEQVARSTVQSIVDKTCRQIYEKEVRLIVEQQVAREAISSVLFAVEWHLKASDPGEHTVGHLRNLRQKELSLVFPDNVNNSGNNSGNNSNNTSANLNSPKFNASNSFKKLIPPPTIVSTVPEKLASPRSALNHERQELSRMEDEYRNKWTQEDGLFLFFFFLPSLFLFLSFLSCLSSSRCRTRTMSHRYVG
jgi:hypothetical protein